MDINLIIKMAHLAVDKIENENKIHSIKFDNFSGVFELANEMIWNEIDEGNISMPDGFKSIDAIRKLCYTPSAEDRFI